MKKPNNQKMFVIRKYVMARDVKEAIKKDRLAPIDDCYVSDDWKEGKNQNLASAIGFLTDNEEPIFEYSKKIKS